MHFSFKNDLLDVYYMPGTVLDTGDSEMSKEDKDSTVALLSLLSSSRDQP